MTFAGPNLRTHLKVIDLERSDLGAGITNLAARQFRGSILKITPHDKTSWQSNMYVNPYRLLLSDCKAKLICWRVRIYFSRSQQEVQDMNRGNLQD